MLFIVKMLVKVIKVMERRPRVKWIICQYYALLLIHEREDFYEFINFFHNKENRSHRH